MQEAPFAPSLRGGTRYGKIARLPRSDDAMTEENQSLQFPHHRAEIAGRFAERALRYQPQAGRHNQGRGRHRQRLVGRQHLQHAPERSGRGGERRSRGRWPRRHDASIASAYPTASPWAQTACHFAHCGRATDRRFDRDRDGRAVVRRPHPPIPGTGKSIPGCPSRHGSGSTGLRSRINGGTVKPGHAGGRPRCST